MVFHVYEYTILILIISTFVLHTIFIKFLLRSWYFSWVMNLIMLIRL